MQIWIDGDACPKLIKDILFRACVRTKIQSIIVANQLISTPPSPFIKRVQVSHGFDSADKYIVEHVLPGDLVITADIPLADLVVTKGAVALNPRGDLYTKQTIKHHLGIRNLNENLRSCQLVRGGPDKISPKNIQLFANNLDKILIHAKH